MGLATPVFLRRLHGSAQRGGDVLAPVLSSTFGVIIFMRLGRIVGELGLSHALLVVALAFVVLWCTVGSLSALLSTCDRPRGLFDAFTRTLGARMAQCLALLFFFAFAVGSAYYLLGFAEITQHYFHLQSSLNVLPWNDAGSWLSVLLAFIVLVNLLAAHAMGLTIRRKVLRVVLVIMLVAIVTNLVLVLWPNTATNTGFRMDHFHENARGAHSEAFVWGFTEFFPAFTGILAGAHLAEHVSMRSSKKLTVQQLIRGLHMAIVIAFAVYGTLCAVLAGSVHRHALVEHTYIVTEVVDSILGVPVIFVGVAFTTLSSALSNLLGASYAFSKFTALSAYEEEPLGTQGASQQPGEQSMSLLRASQSRLSAVSSTSTTATSLAAVIRDETYVQSDPFALFWSWTMVQFAILCGTVDLIIPVVSATFLLTFAVLNFVCLFHAISSDNFAPKFRLYSPWVSVLGFVLSLGAFFVVVSTLFIVLALIYVSGFACYYRREIPHLLQQLREARRLPRDLSGRKLRRVTSKEDDGVHDEAVRDCRQHPVEAHKSNTNQDDGQDKLGQYVSGDEEYCAPLLEEETAGWDVNASQRRLELAAMFVRDAIRGRFLGEEYIEEGLYRARYKRLFHALHFARMANMTVLMLLTLVERPAWCFFRTSCGSRDQVLTWNLPVLPREASIVIELVCLTVMGMEMCMKYSSLGPRLYFANWWRVIQVPLLLAEAVSVLIVVFIPIDDTPFPVDQAQAVTQPIVLAPLLRPLLVLTMSYRLRSAFVSLLKSVPRFMDGIMTIVVLITLYAVLGMLLFEGTREGEEYFPNFQESCMSLVILLTTANFPDVMMPIYAETRVGSLFFISFLTIGLLLVMNLVFASIYQNYRQEVRNHVYKRANNRTRALGVAFKLLVVDTMHEMAKMGSATSFELRQQHTKERISQHTFDRLITELRRPTFSIFHDDIDDVEDDMAEELERNGLPSHRARIDIVRFTVMVKEFAVAHRERERMRPFRRSRRHHSLAWVDRVLSFVTGDSFERTIDVVILTNMVVIWMEIQAKIDADKLHQPNPRVFENIMPVYSALYLLEMVLKMYARGFSRYFSSFKNLYDCIVTVVISIAEISYQVHYVDGMSWNWVRALLVLRFLRCLRLLVALRSLNAMFAIVLRLLPAFTTLYGMLGVVMIEYAVIGMQLFGGKLYVGHPVLTNIQYGQSNYYSNNFNDLASSLVTLFELLVVNNWFVIMEGGVAVTSRWSRIYFVSYYVIAVVMVLSLVVAFVVEAYFEAVSALESKDEPLTKGGTRSQVPSTEPFALRSMSSLPDDEPALSSSSGPSIEYLQPQLERTGSNAAEDEPTTWRQRYHELLRQRTVVLRPREDSVYVEEFL